MEENEVNNAGFNPAGNDGPKKKSIVPVVILVVLIAAICGVGYCAMGAKSPEKFFESVVAKTVSGIQSTNGEANYAFTLDLDVTEPEGTETPIVKVLNELTGKMTTEVGEDKFQVGFYVDRAGKVVGDIDVIATAEDNKAYVKLAPIVEEYVEYEYDEEETNVKEVIEAAKTAAEKIPEKRIAILNDELATLITKEQVSKEKATIEVDGKKVNATAYMYTTTYKEAREMLVKFADDLLANEEFLATFDNEKVKQNTIDSLNDLKEQYSEESEQDNSVLNLTVYATGLMGNKIVRSVCEITPAEVTEEDKPVTATVDIISEYDYNYSLVSGDSTINGTIHVNKESDKKYDVTVTAETEGYVVKAIVGVEELDGADIPDVSSLKTVKTEDLNTWTLLLNLMNSEAYKIYSEIFPEGMGDTDDYTSVEATPFDDEEDYDFEYDYDSDADDLLTVEDN